MRLTNKAFVALNPSLSIPWRCRFLALSNMYGVYPATTFYIAQSEMGELIHS
jgi:hypothetical protein